MGVLSAAILVSLGGAWYLWLHGNAPIHGKVALPAQGPDQPSGFWVAFLQGLHPLRPEGLMALGLLLLILTPVVRVGLSALLFGEEGDWTFFLLTLWVLGLLVASLLGLL